jgi:histidyl-tRNA synthetase
MAKINTAPLSGMRDFLPLDVLRRNYAIDIIKRVYQKYGFEPLETPTMERLSTLLGKYGEEGDHLLFRVMKRGEKLDEALQDKPTQDTISDAGMRYDLTVPLARVVAEYRAQLPRVFKRYQIQPVYRADRPAKGRYREFFQCDVDVIGSTSKTVESEVIAAGVEVLKELGFGPQHPFAIRINSRGVLHGLMEVAGVPTASADSVLVAIDKLDKIGLEGVRRELAERGIESNTATKLLDTIAAAPAAGNNNGNLGGNLGGNTEMLAWLSDLLEDSAKGSTGVEELRQVIRYSANGPAAEYLRIDPYLARGLSYYTGPIYEIEFPGFAGSGGAGGRYDDLIGMFSGQSIPACGFSLGLERILLLMEEQNMFPARLAGQPQVLVTLFDEASTGPSLRLAHQLRALGLRVDVYPDQERYGRQFKYGEDRKIRYALLLSPREIEAGVVAVKDLVSGDQIEMPPSEVAEWLLARVE